MIINKQNKTNKLSSVKINNNFKNKKYRKTYRTIFVFPIINLTGLLSTPGPRLIVVLFLFIIYYFKYN